jgi:hypothetical protein
MTTYCYYRHIIIRLAALLLLALAVTAGASCRNEPLPNRPMVAVPSTALWVAPAMAPTTAPTAAPTATPTVAPTATPEPAAAVVGRWRYEHAEEGLAHAIVIEFFADGLFSAVVEGVVSPCLLLPIDLCQLMPMEMPFALVYSGRYLSIAADRVRLDIEQPIDPTLALFLKQFDQQLEAFDVSRPDDDTLVLEQDGLAYTYSRVR